VVYAEAIIPPHNVLVTGNSILSEKFVRKNAFDSKDRTNSSKTESTMTAPQKPFSIAICDGGIAGLVLAISLLKCKVLFHLYESAYAFAEFGTGVVLEPNSIIAMGTS